MVAIPDKYPLINDMYEAAANYDRGPKRNYLGMSQIGRSCGRALWYSFRGFTPSAVDGRAKMIFSLGDRVEEEVIKWLSGKYQVKDQQHDFTAINGFFKGHWDGLLVGMTKKPHVLEVKSANSRRFKAYKAEGIQKMSPEYYCQIQCYMGYSGYDRGVFVIMNKDNCELYSECVKYSKDDFVMIERRATNIIYSDEAPQKVETTACEYCGYRQLCTDGKYIQTNCTCGTCRFLRADKDTMKLYCSKFDHIGGIESQHWGKFCSKWEYIYEDS